MEEWNLGSLTLRSQGNHEAVCLLVRWKCKSTPQTNCFGTHLLVTVDSLKHKFYIMSPRWHLGLIYVGTKLAINSTYVPIVAPFQTDMFLETGNMAAAGAHQASAVSTASQLQASRVCTTHSFSTYFNSLSNLEHHYQRLTVGWWSKNDLLGEMYSSKDVYLNENHNPHLNLFLSSSIESGLVFHGDNLSLIFFLPWRMRPHYINY